MDLAAAFPLGNPLYRNVQVWQVGSHTIEAVVQGRRIRITARELIGAETPSFHAEYEERKHIETIGVDHPVWTSPGDDIEIPWATGTSVEDCLAAGLSQVVHSVA